MTLLRRGGRSRVAHCHCAPDANVVLLDAPQQGEESGFGKHSIREAGDDDMGA